MAYTLIDDPSAYFQTKLYTGTGSELVLTNDGNSDLQPDFLWIKNRTDASTNHHAHNTNVASTQTLFVNKTDYEETQSQSVKSIQSDGFTLGTWGGNNLSSKNFVAWQWKANGGTTSSNTDGSITSTVQANQDAGFSIVTYTGTGANATVGHGLGVTPNIVFYKNRTDSGITGSTNGNWIVQSSALNVDEYIKLNDSAAAATDTGYFRSTRPSSTVLTLGNYNSNNGSNDNLVAYCFSEKQGYSKFGSYVGNGTGTSDGTFNGTFVYTGFKPAWVMVKRSSYSAGDGWEIWDSTRPPRGGSTTDGNYINNKLNAASAGAESGNVYDAVDFLSNGFKLRTGRAGTNASGSTYIYMAFAENPFVTSTGIPTTAR